MASSRKPPSGSLAVALSGGVDSVVLLHQLSRRRAVTAIHVHHGLSPNAGAWARSCRALCRRLGVPLQVKRVKVVRGGKGLEAAAREARYAAFADTPFDVIALAHTLDDQAETVLMNLLRGAGARGASGMPERARRGRQVLWRPLLEMPRAAIEAYARLHGLAWIEDESNADESLTRNFIRRRVAPLLDERFPAWRESLARSARLFARKEAGAEELLRAFLRSKGLRAPSEARLAEMLKQLRAGGSRTLIEHDGRQLRLYRGEVTLERAAGARRADFAPLAWQGERRLALPGGELRFRRARGKGIALEGAPLTVGPRRGGERLQPDERRPSRTLKNLFQEAGVPPWVRESLPLVYCGDALAWAPGLGVDVRFRAAAGAPGVLPEWRPLPA